MASTDDKRTAIARVYAGSLLELALEADRSDEMLAQLEGLAALVRANDDLETFFESPLIERAHREESLEKMFRGRLDDLVVDTLHIMHRKGRLGLVRELAVAYRAALQKAKGRIDVRVTSAVDLDEGSRERLVAVLRELTGQEPVLAERVEPGLLGGLVLRIGDRKIDGSIRRKIRRIRDRLRERAGHQILLSRVAGS